MEVEAGLFIHTTAFLPFCCFILPLAQWWSSPPTSASGNAGFLISNNVCAASLFGWDRTIYAGFLLPRLLYSRVAHACQLPQRLSRFAFRCWLPRLTVLHAPTPCSAAAAGLRVALYTRRWRILSGLLWLPRCNMHAAAVGSCAIMPAPSPAAQCAQLHRALRLAVRVLPCCRAVHNACLSALPCPERPLSAACIR